MSFLRIFQGYFLDSLKGSFLGPLGSFMGSLQRSSGFRAKGIRFMLGLFWVPLRDPLTVIVWVPLRNVQKVISLALLRRHK